MKTADEILDSMRRSAFSFFFFTFITLLILYNTYPFYYHSYFIIFYQNPSRAYCGRFKIRQTRPK